MNLLINRIIVQYYSFFVRIIMLFLFFNIRTGKSLWMQNCVTKQIKQKKSLFGDERIWLCVKSRRTRWWVAQCEVWCTKYVRLKITLVRSVDQLSSFECDIFIDRRSQFQQQFACVPICFRWISFEQKPIESFRIVSGGKNCLTCGTASTNVTNLNASASSCCESFIYSDRKTRKKRNCAAELIEYLFVFANIRCRIVYHGWRKTLVSSTVYVNRQCKSPHAASLFRSHYYYFLFYNWTKSYEKAVKLERLPEYLRDTVDWFMG